MRKRFGVSVGTLVLSFFSPQVGNTSGGFGGKVQKHQFASIPIKFHVAYRINEQTLLSLLSN